MTAMALLDKCRAAAGTREAAALQAAATEVTLRLKGLERKVAREYYIRARSQRSIAAEMRYSYGYIRCILYYARKKLDEVPQTVVDDALSAAQKARKPKKSGV